jgi:hypothetical protein
MDCVFLLYCTFIIFFNISFILHYFMIFWQSIWWTLTTIDGKQKDQIKKNVVEEKKKSLKNPIKNKRKKKIWGCKKRFEVPYKKKWRIQMKKGKKIKLRWCMVHINNVSTLGSLMYSIVYWWWWWYWA